MKLLTFDIETIPQRRWVDFNQVGLDELEPDDLDRFRQASERLGYDQRTGDPAAMVAAAEGSLKLKATGTVPACHPSTCRVVGACWGYLDKDGNPQTRAHTLTDFRQTIRQKPIQRWREKELDYAEELLLTRCLQAIRKVSKADGRLVTFNGKGFDLPIVRWRSAMLGVEPVSDTGSLVSRWEIKWRDMLYPFSNKPHCDIRLLLSDGAKYARGTLEHWAGAFGIPVKQAGHGSQVYERLHNVRGWKWLHKYAEEEALVLLKF